jgi:hypothetical protein
MKTGNWIPVDKDIVKYLPKGGKPFSVAEAYLSFRVDVDNNREWTINGYAVLWGWGRTKVQRFTSDLLDTGKGAKHESSNGHAKDGQSICFKFKDLSDESSKCRATVKQESSTTNNTNKRKEKPLPDSFERFWKVYPYKSAKEKAKAAWIKLDPSEEVVERIIAAVERKRESDAWLEKGGKYIPLPTTYLNGRRWEDQEPEVAPAGNYEPFVL